MFIWRWLGLWLVDHSQSVSLLRNRWLLIGFSYSNDLIDVLKSNIGRMAYSDSMVWLMCRRRMDGIMSLYMSKGILDDTYASVQL